MVKDESKKIERIKKQKRFQVPPTPAVQKTWESITRNYDLIEGAQLSSSFVILMTLDNSEEPLTSSDISKFISYHSLGHIYKPASTLKDALQNRLERDGYVEGVVQDNRTHYVITSKGKKLLKGWVSFLSAYE